MEIVEIVARELNLEPGAVARSARLLDEGNTIPFIARYRKEMTGGLSEEKLLAIEQALNYQRSLAKRKEEIKHLLEVQEQLTPELEKEILEATKLQQLEDIYRPFRPKRNTRAAAAKEKGLEPLALAILAGEGPPEQLAPAYVDPEKELDEKAVLQGASDIIAEKIADDPDNRRLARRLAWAKAQLVTRAIDPEKPSPYRMYYDFRQPVRELPAHRVLAINRGEKEKILRVVFELEEKPLLVSLWQQNFREAPEVNTVFLQETLIDAYRRLLGPAIERDLRRELTEKAHEQAYRVFQVNLESLLLQPPTPGRTVLGVDPAYRTGCKLAVVDSTGKLLETGLIYPHAPQKKWEEAKDFLKRLIEKHRIELVAVGNGTASHESADLVAEVLSEIKGEVAYTVVDEGGASVYSASVLAREEFPGLDVAERSAVSIARRLQDPLAELVKIPPGSLGVGQYQHDVDQKKLVELLGAVVGFAVNRVGADLNTASASLLTYISGIKPAQAKAIIKKRNEEGSFKSRREILTVPRLGEVTFQQCAGFLRVSGGEEPLDETQVHPESYQVVERLLEHCGYQKRDLKKGGLPEISKRLPANLEDLARLLDTGLPTLEDIIEALQKPGRDPREELPPPLFRRGILTLEQLQEGQVLEGTVKNVVDFGAFVDVGIKESGLVHISEISRKFVKHPLDVLQVGQRVWVKVLQVDLDQRRLGLSIKQAEKGKSDT